MGCQHFVTTCQPHQPPLPLVPCQINYKPKPGYELTAAQSKLLQDFRSNVAAAKQSLADLMASWHASRSTRFADADMDEEDAGAGAGAWEEWTTARAGDEEEGLFQAVSQHAHGRGHGGHHGAHGALLRSNE
jgi:hypothetical protein